MRGQPCYSPQTGSGSRIIPARAGPTPEEDVSCRARADHPRSCGANTRAARPTARTGGSSPLVRGQRTGERRRRARRRIIPARAGPTSFFWNVIFPHPDHPRSCGANYAKNMKTHTGEGSSPLVRGQPMQMLRTLTYVRIIPARAGPTSKKRVRAIGETDHPRSCGANSLILRGKSGLSQIKIFDYSSGIWQ